MSKSQRRPQQLFAIVMWALSFVFAGFLIGLGGLIIKDLPSVDATITLQQFADADALREADAILETERSRLLGIQRNVEDAQQNYLSAQADYQQALNSFETWIATRTATQSDAQNPQVLSRSRGVDELKSVERVAQRLVTDAQIELRQAERGFADARTLRNDVLNEAQPAYRAALSAQQLRVFLFRLALTVPLLLLAGWVIMKKLSANTCPGCDRKIIERDDMDTDFCVHCGIRLHCKCKSCSARNNSFHRFCLSCGVPASKPFDSDSGQAI